MKASAVAHPIQGLIKYHGLRDERLRIPFHDSISVCTAPLATHTTVEFGRGEDSAEFDGHKASPQEMARIMAVVDPLRQLAGEKGGMRMISHNNFRSNIGLGASASGFAALALACAEALSLDLPLKDISRYARRGAGSAARAVTGGFSIWHAGVDDESSYSEMIASSKDMDMGILAVIVPAYKVTDTAHREVVTSPFFQARLETVNASLEQMLSAISSGDVNRVGELAEKDTLVLHSITMTGSDQMLLWRPETLRIMARVKELRYEGLNCHFSIDTGATVYVNCPLRKMEEVEDGLKDLELPIMKCQVGDQAKTVSEHLF